MPIAITDSSLKPIRDKLMDGQRLSLDDGLQLAQSNDLLGIGALANHVREKLHGDKTFFNINRHINYTNVCSADCAFCAFARLPDQDGGWTCSLDEIFEKAEKDCPPGCTELHIVGGLHPDLPFQYYLDMLSGLKERFPHLHLKAFTAIELAHFSKISGLHVREVIRQLIDCGLGSLPGGGAEVFEDDIRRGIASGKANAKGWLNIHRIAHEEGLKTNATMLYGHVESWENRLEHLDALRKLQDKTGGFQTFIPLAFHPANTRMDDLPGPSGLDDLRMMAVSRLMLDNFPHIKAYWVMMGIKMAQVALSFGADDLDGTVVEETIYHMAGSDSPQTINVKDLRNLIREAGRQPVQRDTLYNEIADQS